MKVLGKVTSVLILALVIGLFLPNLIIYAVEPNFTMHVTGSDETTTKAKMKDQISIDIELKNGLENKQTLGIVIVYDSSKLEAVPDTKTNNQLQWKNSLSNDIPTENSTIKLGQQVNVSENSSLKKIVLAFCNESALNTNGKIGTLKFNVISEGMSEIYFSGIKYGSINNPNEAEIECNSQSKITVISEAELAKPSDDKTSSKPIKDLDKINFNEQEKVQGIQTVINNMYQANASKQPVKAIAVNNQENVFEEINNQVNNKETEVNKVEDQKIENKTLNTVNENTENLENNVVSNSISEEKQEIEQESINADSKVYNSEENEASDRLEEVNQEIELQNELMNTRKIILLGIAVVIITLIVILSVVIIRRK